jgi:hypothetical protein
MNDGESSHVLPFTINEHRCGNNNMDPKFTYNIRLTITVSNIGTYKKLNQTGDYL